MSELDLYEKLSHAMYNILSLDSSLWSSFSRFVTQNTIDVCKK